ncbi:MAG: hypothetical protein HZB53_15930 [Chloroflexi bacterium]|nr:hypothetical protein [Chloroflexota bacterium]
MTPAGHSGTVLSTGFGRAHMELLAALRQRCVFAASVDAGYPVTRHAARRTHTVPD